MHVIASDHNETGTVLTKGRLSGDIREELLSLLPQVAKCYYPR